METAEAIGCLFCQTGCEVCAPQQIWPSWFKVGETTPVTQLVNVQSGKHPLGVKLGERGYCGGCRWVKRGKHVSCGNHRREVRLYWKGCEDYEESPW